jgi:hypothetical protein
MITVLFFDAQAPPSIAKVKKISTASPAAYIEVPARHTELSSEITAHRIDLEGLGV